MKSTFDYKKAKEEAERMLEVIERDPQAVPSTWADSVQKLVPVFYSIAISQHLLSIQTNALKEAGLYPKEGIENMPY